MKHSLLQTRRKYAIVAFAALLLATLPVVARAQSKATMSDAAVESNVLRQLASAPDLSNQNIQSTSVFGNVTLTGNVQSEALRSEAENLVARADGVKKVVDEMTIGATASDDQPAMNPDQPGPDQSNNVQPNDDQPTVMQPTGRPAPGMVLQSDGSYAPAQPGDQGEPQPSNPAEANNQPPPDNGYNQPPPNNGYNQPAPPPQPMANNGYAPPPNSYGPPPDNGRSMPGQPAGMVVTVPSGVALHVRINRGLDANHVHPGTPFDGTVLNDVVIGGVVAIPRGAQVQGAVVDAKRAGAVAGHGDLGLQLTNLTLGGRNYPLSTVAWNHQGRDKTDSTVGRAVGFGALGALFGAAVGGGAGAAIGAGVGGVAGVASSAGTPAGRVVVPPESVLTFQLAQPETLSTVSQREMERMAYAAGPPPRRYNGPYGPYGPAY